jgi:hypothetical protein
MYLNISEFNAWLIDFHLDGALFKLHADAAGLYGLRVAVPGNRLHAGLGDIATKTAEALHQDGFSPLPGGGQGCGQAAGSGSHH